MIRGKKIGFGMKSNNNNKVIFLSIAFLVIGLVIGIIIPTITSFTINTTIELSSLISILGLVATIFIMPFIINEKKNREHKINEIALKDLDDICKEIQKLRDIYEDMLNITKARKQNTPIIVGGFKRISNLLYTLSTEFDNCGILPDFKQKIIADSYTKAYSSCTENLLTKDGLSDDDIRRAQNELNDLYSEIKKTRYKIYK